jgi:hypothetical protein
MFDAVEAFEKQFKPYEDGYLFFPSSKTGGKFISEDEYAALVTDWTRVAGKRGILKIVATMTAAILIWSALESSADFPDWAEKAFVGAMVAALLARLYWASAAIRRPLMDRPDIAPPRTGSEARLAAQRRLSWPVVVFGILLCSLAFIPGLFATECTIGSWLWLVGSGTLLSGYLWIALQKWRDQGSADHNE